MEEIAKNIISKNIVNHNDKNVLVAGGSIYYSMWSRDFLYAAEFLMKRKEWRPVIKDTLDLILENIKEKENKMCFRKPASENLLPKGIDTLGVQWRVVRGSIRSMLNLEPERIKHRGPWKVLHKDIVGSEAIDTNLLFIKVALELSNYPEYKNYASSNSRKIATVLSYYGQHGLINDYTGYLIRQPYCSDWKDSLSRYGITFLTNLIYWKVVTLMEKSGLFSNLPSSDYIRDQLIKKFYDKNHGVFLSVMNQTGSESFSPAQYYGVDENLLTLHWGFLKGVDVTNHSEFNEDPFVDTLYKNVISKWERNEFGLFIGSVVSPGHPWYDKPFHMLISGIHGYHDNSAWSWVYALAGIVCFEMNDIERGFLICQTLEEVVCRDNTIFDAYFYRKDSNGRPIDFYQASSRMFRAEHDWTWGAAFVLELCSLKYPQVIHY